MSSVEKWLTGVTVVAVVATAVSSSQTAPILTALFGGIAKVYQGARK